MKFSLLLTLLFLVLFSQAQNYQAIHGSPYAGSLAPSQNPAAIVHVPYPWDLTIFAVQARHSTNAFRLEGLSYFSVLAPPDSITIAGTNGIRKHFLYTNQDVHLFNFRANIGPRAAISFGGNVRSYLMAESMNETNFQDTIQFLRDFMRINLNTQPLAANVTGSAWAEWYAGFAYNIVDDGDRLVNVGFTLKGTKSLAGLAVNAADLSFSPSSSNQGNNDFYTLTNGNLSYGYSANFDSIDSLKSTKANMKAFVNNAKNNFSADLGVEYIIMANEEEDAYGSYAYETKFGLSIMDIGNNKFTYGTRSRSASGLRSGVSDSILENRFSGAENLDGFNDSLADLVNSFNALEGDFSINRPTRMLVNIDKHITNNIFINAELTIPLSGNKNKKSQVRELNLLSVTPRWELKSIGFYIPFQYNNRNQFWVGGAMKAGPLLLGTHNLASFISNKKIQTGGFYLAFTVRPGKKNDRGKYLPGRIPGGNEARGVKCPKF